MQGLYVKEARGVHKILSLAFNCMFDIDGVAARKYMDNCVLKRRDVTPIGAFNAAGDFLRLGIREAKNKKN